MSKIIEALITIVCAVIASSGFWAYLQSHGTHKDAMSRMVIGLAHDRIINLGSEYLRRGYILIDEYENLNDYLYEPYVALGGNGSAKKIMEHVRKLPIYNTPPRKDDAHEVQ